MKRQNHQDVDHTLKNRLDQEMFTKLKSKKKELKHKQEMEKEKERQRALKLRREKEKEREANKSFSELLEESDLDWKKFKS